MSWCVSELFRLYACLYTLKTATGMNSEMPPQRNVRLPGIHTEDRFDFQTFGSVQWKTTIIVVSLIQLKGAMPALKVVVLGSTGYGGSHLCVELLNRGHHVVGIARSPAKIGSHSRYTPVSVDFDTVSVKDLTSAIKGADVLVNEYGPHSGGAGNMLYRRAKIIYNYDYLLSNTQSHLWKLPARLSWQSSELRYHTPL